MRNPTLAIGIIGLLFAGATGCAGMKEAAPSSADAPQDFQSASEEVERLTEAIVLNSGAPAERPSPADPVDARKTEDTPSARSDAGRAFGCDDVCEASAGICASANRICQIAAQLPDPHFAERCAWASDQCQAGKRRCAECR